MRDSDVNLFDRKRLSGEFGSVLDRADDGLWTTEHDLAGATYRDVLGQMSRIVDYQWSRHLMSSALKGFLLHGPPGVGKTTLARRLTYELSHLAALEDDANGTETEVVMILVDGGDLARGLYGDTEEQLKQLFELARNGQAHSHHHFDDKGGMHIHADGPVRRTVLLFDDVESLFMHRGSSNAREWHFSQNSVFFHLVDEMDTGHTAIVLTTNRLDLLDQAIIDRFMPYGLETPSQDVLERIARDKGGYQGLGRGELEPVLEEIRSGRIHSVREVERLVMQAFVEVVSRSTDQRVAK